MISATQKATWWRSAAGMETNAQVTRPYQLRSLLDNWFNDCVENTMIAWKFQCGEGHIFDVFLFPSIVLPCLNHAKIFLRKQNKIFWIYVTFGPFFITFACLVKLRLQVCSCIIRGVVLRIWRVTPTRCELFKDEK